jgi:predicted MPP superfamily phosphohydrolase
MSNLPLFNRREILRLSAGSLLAYGLWPGALRAADAGGSGDFTFIAVNDLHYQSERCGVWFERVVRQMKAHEPKAAFCLIIGDYAEHGLSAEMGAARAAFQELGLPVHGVVGNHDYTEDGKRAAYEKLFPKALNYYFVNDGWQFVGLDTTQGRAASGTTIHSDTLKYVDNILPKLDRSQPLVIFTHFPLGLLTPGRPRNADDLLIRFKEHNLQAVLSGHFHGFTERFFGRVTLTTNRCCAISRENHDGTPEKGYFLCSAKEGRVTRTFVEVKPV